jgi:molybdopterin molybdotransferase
MAHPTFVGPESGVVERAFGHAQHGAAASSHHVGRCEVGSHEIGHHNVGWHKARELAAELGRRSGNGSRRASQHAPAEGATEEVPLADAAGRILAADVIAVADLPRFATAAMDGWVLSACAPDESSIGGTPPGWKLDTAIAAGDPPSAAPMLPGSARPISTGAPVPAGAAAILRSELGTVSVGRTGSRGQSTLGSTHPVRANEHIRLPGEEARHGEVLLYASDTLTPPRIALAAAAGRDTLPVLRLPTVELLLLGDELARTGHPRGGQVRDALGPAVPPIVAALGLAMGRLSYVPDDLAATVAAVRGATADVVVTTGGSSHGSADHVREALRAVGARLIVDGVAMRPGHPVILAELPDGRPLLCLPGNPLAALVCLISFAVPLADALLGRSPRPLGLSMAATGLPNATASTRLIACRGIANGVVPVEWQGSGMMRGLAHADALAVVPPGGTRKGEPVQTAPLPW